MSDDWKKSREILEQAALESEKCRKEIQELLQRDLTKKNYEKIKKLLKKDSLIRNKALDTAQKIRQNEINKELED